VPGLAATGFTTFEPLAEEHLDGAAVLLAARHAASRRIEPALDPRYEEPELARAEIAPILARDGASGVVALRDGDVAGYLLGVPLDVIWGPNMWVEPAGHAVSTPELVRDLYGAAAAAWVAEGNTSHYAVVPAADPELVDAWFRLGFGHQHVHAIGEPLDEAPALDEVLDAEHTHVSERPEEAPVVPLRGALQARVPVRRARDGEDAVRMLVLGERVAGNAAVAAARGDQRHLAGKVHEALVDERLPRELLESRCGVGSAADARLALAVIPEAARLQDAGRPQRRDGAREVEFRLVGGMDAVKRLALLDPVTDLLEHFDAGALVDWRAGGAREEEDAARPAIEPVDQARPLAARGQRGEHPVQVARGPGAALDREPGRLVQDQERVVLVQDQRAQPFGVLRADGRLPPRRRSARLAQRRDPDALARAQAGVGRGPPAVDPDLAGPQQPLQPAVAELGEMPMEPAVEADLGLVRGDRAHFDPGHLAGSRPRRSLARAWSLRLSAASSPSAVGS